MALRNNEIYKDYGKGMNMDILNKKEINNTDEGMYVSGYAYIQNYSVQPQKNGGQFISGHLQAQGQLPFKVWSDTRPDGAFISLLNNPTEYKGRVCYIKGKVDRFGGNTSLVIDTIRAINSDEVGLTESDFFEEVYDVTKWWRLLEGTIKNNCSDEAYNLFLNIMSSVKSRFVVEFAAANHHDNCKSGLLAHTTKVVKMAALLKMYPNLWSKVSTDALFLACALHDVGKIKEYSNGTISDEGKIISHHTFGVMFAIENKDTIINSMGDKFFLELLSVFEQHHGEWGERPRTTLAYVVHLLDNLDSTLTSLDSMLGETKAEQIVYNGYKLV